MRCRPGEVYYWNCVTDETTFDFPEEMLRVQEDVRAGGAAARQHHHPHTPLTASSPHSAPDYITRGRGNGGEGEAAEGVPRVQIALSALRGARGR